jgi:hypothetical protein
MQSESSAVWVTSACRAGMRASSLGEGGGEREMSGVRCVSSEAAIWVIWALKYRGRWREDGFGWCWVGSLMSVGGEPERKVRIFFA